MSKVVCMKLKVMPNQLESWVAVVTSGPGATNAITGIADAMSDSVPLLSLQVRWREQDWEGCLSGGRHRGNYHANH